MLKRILSCLVLIVLITIPILSHADLTYSVTERHKSGDQVKIDGTITFDSSYATSGETFTASTVGMAFIEDIVIEDSEGYLYDVDVAAGGSTALIKVYNSTSAGTITTTNTAITAGTPTTITSGVFSITDNLNVPTGALVYYDTSTGRFNVALGGGFTTVKHEIALNAMSTHNHTAASTLTATSGSEVANGTNLSTLTVSFSAYGK